MPYKITKSVLKGRTEIAAVPSLWEKDGKLFWPSKQAEIKKLRHIEDSAPGPGWKIYDCKVLADKITSFDVAIDFEERYLTAETEDEDNIAIAGNEPKSKKPKIHSQAEDFNCMITEINRGLTVEDLHEASHHEVMINVGEAIGEEANKSHVQEGHSEMILVNSGAAETPEIVTLRGPDIYETAGDFITKTQFNEFVNLFKNQFDDLMAISNHLKTSINGLHVKLDRVLEQKGKNENVIVEPLLNSMPMIEEFPLKDCDEVLEFNSKLKDENFKKTFHAGMVQYTGISGKEDGTEVALFLTKKLFTNEALSQFSWTGMSRSHQPKQAFRKLSYLLNAFEGVVRAADSTYSELKNQSFFRDKILKHGNARAGKQNKSSEITDVQD